MSDTPLPSVEVGWAYVIKFLQNKKEGLDLDNAHIKVIQDKEVASHDFPELNTSNLKIIGI